MRSIQDFLTDRDNGFIYSLSTSPGTTGDDLVDFLRLRRGYCEQYAGAMAVMVRAAGVPARVALGYTPGTEQPDGSRLITSDDAHAWVEVYFEDLGWVPFDPTPIARDRAVDLPWAPRAGEDDESDDRAQAAVPTAPSQPLPSAPRDLAGGGAPGAQQGESADDALGPYWAPLVPSCSPEPSWGPRPRPVPSSAGAGSRAGRPATCGTSWPPRRWTRGVAESRMDPRRTARELGAVLDRSGSPGEGADVVLRLALAEESASYGPTAGQRVHPELAAALRTARRGLLGALPRAARVRALLWPTSLVSGAGNRLSTAVTRRVPRRLRLRRRTRTA
ncbi:transglutaminase-like domain-containing protein [Blastococcus brunescens]|uniref:Transglutaminase-like domain-containing protein n=1 Tax=Blastococcus brunescens TaxID=1564165 RepID=A0ABZ1B6S1_9ACTN|nr:transglutaminase-like domain-containing protein [Blastococcus sp. BMG 8361]WRL66077.1 transglutaminase-like domain-containing protein [Blastococcus sp. BMG 8361]